MSWECPYQRQEGKDYRCDRLGRPCLPMQEGCILDHWRKSAKAPQRGKVVKPRRSRGRATGKR